MKSHLHFKSNANNKAVCFILKRGLSLNVYEPYLDYAGKDVENESKENVKGISSDGNGPA